MQHINHAEVIIKLLEFVIATLYVRWPYMSDDPICQVTLPTQIVRELCGIIDEPMFLKSQAKSVLTIG